MQIILTTHVKGLGSLGDTVDVRTGYALNYLLPKNKAIEATADNQARFESMRAEYETRLLELTQDTDLKAQKIEQLPISLSVNVSDDGHLYGSVTAKHIVDFYAQHGIQIMPSEVILPAQKIRQLGEYTIGFALSANRTAEQKLVLLATAK